MTWRYAGKNAQSFIILSGWVGPLPKSMTDTFAELDSFYGKMEMQHLKKKAKESSK